MGLMRAAAAAILVFALLAAAGCSPVQGEPGGDGLHSTVPKVTGQTLAEATAQIQDAGYALGSVNPKGAEGSDIVTVQDPAAGTSLARGGEVDVVCGSE